MANKGVKGKYREFERLWIPQPSANLRREWPERGIKVILRRRGDHYEVHAFSLADCTRRIYATRLGGPRMVYWCPWVVEPKGIDQPALFSERTAKHIVFCYLEQIVEMLLVENYEPCTVPH